MITVENIQKNNATLLVDLQRGDTFLLLMEGYDNPFIMTEDTYFVDLVAGYIYERNNFLDCPVKKCDFKLIAK